MTVTKTSDATTSDTGSINVVVPAKTVVVPIADKEITGFIALTTIEISTDEHIVDLGALKASGKLPTKVTVTDGTTPKDATITDWSGSFDGTSTGVKVLTATWTMPSGYIDAFSPINVTINVNVTIAQTTPIVLVTGIKVTSSDTAIILKSGTMQMSVEVSPSGATNKAVTWSVAPSPNGDAWITTEGLLTAIGNGKVTVTATAQDGSAKSGTKEITISNQ